MDVTLIGNIKKWVTEFEYWKIKLLLKFVNL